ncbi:asparagine synthase (glutamine-hydrolyzing) [Thalassoroseus pseudoceratinae]|uniref:asparagine synthase (glutamine-hydrolyzing) n=1 Tax=Thalassoroseus pseudoceratinae TaxID=2713176 RepID=UPI00141F82BD|nr:asparagine synthase (glutamine-hydrolyzing) [Thalassoroseus pseudoceratinae]
MCGIAGAFWSGDGEPLSEELLHRMTSTLRHRGPDADGFHLTSEDQFGGAALGHRRLSIIDIGGGKQPLCNEDETVWVSFNGEIYNYRELRSDLQSRGHQFRTDSDTEVIVHAYEEYGDDCVDHFRGMFVFAIWDTRKHRGLIARDRIGQKPLFYREHAGRVVFASELKALLQLPDAVRELNPAAVDAYLQYQYVPHPMCILKGYAKLPPAHRMTFEGGKLSIERYWSPPYERPIDQKVQSDWSEHLRETLTEAVRLRMRSDVPLGAFLSGGIDSTLIAGLMQQESDRQVQTYSIGFPVKQFDERHFARMAAEHLGTDHYEFVVEPKAVETLPRLIWHYDEPFADSSAIPTMALCQVTRQAVTVALSGDGGDELFAGYDRYRAVAFGAKFDRLPKPLRQLLTAKLWQQVPASSKQKSFRRRLKRLLAGLRLPPELRYLNWVGIFDSQRRQSLYSDEFRTMLQDVHSENFLLSSYELCPSRDIVTRATAADVLTYLPCDILTKVDIASMAVGLECRSPFLDHHVVELAARMPLEWKMSGGRGKRILTETFDDLIPEPIQNRAKMGFGVPLDSWFRDELRPLLDDVLLSQRALDRGLFRPDAVRELVREHVSGQWDHSARLWALICLEGWQRVYLDQPSPAECPTEFSSSSS